MTEVYDDLASRLPAPGQQFPAPYSLLEVSGRDAVGFLQRLCSQDVELLAEGRSVPTAFLDPKGRVQAIGRLARTGDTVVVETQTPQLERLYELLDRYHFTEQLELRRREDLVCGSVRGRGACEALGREAGVGAVGPEGLRLVVADEREGLGLVRFHGSEEAVRSALDGLPEWTDEQADAARILTAEPWVGLDTEATTLALEAGLDDHVSTTKGCYTGQEIVARIHTYGHVNRRLVRLSFADPGTAPERSTPLCLAEDGTPLGRVMSSARLEDGCRVALGYLPESFLSEPEPLVLGEQGGVAVTILADRS